MGQFLAQLTASPFELFFGLVAFSWVIFYVLVLLKRHKKARWLTKFAASLTLAILIIVAIAVISAVGTIVESRYDLSTAQRTVYQTFWMWGILFMLCINLIGVMADRWPWKKHHTSFVLAHIGIIVTLIGSVLTYTHGIDGSMRLAIGQSSSMVTMPATDLVVWASYDGQSYTKLYESDSSFHNVDVKSNPVKIPLPDAELSVTDFYPFALGSSKLIANEKNIGGPAIRFQMDNTHVSVNKWMFAQRAEESVQHEFGPARIVLFEKETPPSGRNEIILFPKNANELNYRVYYKDGKKKPLKGVVKQGEIVETGWMGLKFRLLRYIRHAENSWTFEPKEYPNKMTTEALKVKFNDQTSWVQLNSVVKLFSDKAVYIVSYANRRLDLKVPIRLEKFSIGRYQGTMRAASYASDVFVKGVGKVNISMNEPLKHAGYTFYQASFEEDERGRPTHSILSVNFDPGRGLKYLGCIILVLGSALLFWRKRLLKPKGVDL